MTHPIVPAMYRRDNAKYVFVFTPERMIAYLAEKIILLLVICLLMKRKRLLPRKIQERLCIIKAVSMAERKSIKLFFASPNIPNSDIFFKIVR